MAEIKGGLVGAKSVSFAVLDKNGAILLPTKGGIGDATTGIYEVTGDNSLGVASVALSGLAQTSTPVWGSNMKVDSTFSKINPSVAITINALPFDIKMALLGYVKEDGGYVAPEKPNKVAMTFTTNLLSGDDLVFGFPDGYITAGDVTANTNQDTEQRSQDVFTVAVNDSTELDGAPYKVYSQADSDFDKAQIALDIFQVAKPTTPAGE